MKNNTQSKKIVLIQLMGMSPAVLTETIWALAVQYSLIPDEVIILGTDKSISNLHQKMFAENIWNEFLKDFKNSKYNIKNKLTYGKSQACNIIFPSMDNSKDLSDVRNLDDSESVGNTILKVLNNYTSNPDIRIIASIAGGRKTMGAIFTTCMTLLARPSDMLCHVLVSDPFENQSLVPQFFYPKKEIIHELNDKQFPSKKCTLTLSEIPFIRLRSWYEKELKSIPRTSFKELVSILQGKVSAKLSNITLKLSNKELCLGGGSINLSPIQAYSMFLYFNKIKKDGFVSSWKELVSEENDAKIKLQNFTWFNDMKIKQFDVNEDLRKSASEIKKKLLFGGASKNEIDLIFPDFQKKIKNHFPAGSFSIV
ncbi:MAG: CRISPR-associated protein, NE0113 family [uncultured bacterium]|nr:MAG: CRISPR-associated protein, NE0113 family [uncultured bacterium]